MAEKTAPVQASHDELRDALDEYCLHRMNDYLLKAGVISQRTYAAVRQQIWVTYRSVEIKQSAGTKDTFDITIWPGDNTIQMQTKEKERFELFLLAHPLVEAHTHYIF